MTAEQFEPSLELDSFSSMPMESLEHDVLTDDNSFSQNLAIPNVDSVLQNKDVAETSGIHNPTGALLQIPISVQVILGSTTMILSKVMALGPGSIISLDQQLSEPVRLLVNGNVFARGTIVVIDEVNGQLGVTLTDISPDSASLKITG
jgi:flagellar motor switch protein FliN